MEDRLVADGFAAEITEYNRIQSGSGAVPEARPDSAWSNRER